MCDAGDINLVSAEAHIWLDADPLGHCQLGGLSRRAMPLQLPTIWWRHVLHTPVHQSAPKSVGHYRARLAQIFGTPLLAFARGHDAASLAETASAAAFIVGNVPIRRSSASY